MWSEAVAALERYFGYRDLRPGQREAITSALERRHALVVMPTGGGKSLCYQVPALILPGLTLVISPLISLMKDQVAALERRGIAATLVNSSLTSAEIEERLRLAVAGRLKLLYLAPERFESSSFKRAVRQMDVGLVAIDEAHCVSEWGHDFRPSYLRLRQCWPRIGHPGLIALTATATPEVRRDIVTELGLRRPRVIVRGFDRPNLRWVVRREEKLAGKSRALLSTLSGCDASAVVYASTRKMVEAATALLRGAGVGAAAYHAGLTREQRARVQEAWTLGRLPVVVATNAFGMGIDKEDVRRVVHFQMPGTLEAYYQEAGRAGRDGQPAQCVLLHSYRDRFTHEFFVHSAYPPRKIIASTYRALQAAAATRAGPVPLSLIARRVPGLKSDAQVHSSLRILAQSGAVEDVGKRRGCVIRWIASPEQAARLAEDAHGGDAADGGHDVETRAWALGLLERLLQASAWGSRRRLRFSRHEIARWTGGDFDVARAALDALQAAGVLGWRDEGRRSGYRLSVISQSSAELPVDWEAVARRRAFELQKLKRMQDYVYQRGCRRRFLLRYFGETFERGRCSGCDRCS